MLFYTNGNHQDMGSPEIITWPQLFKGWITLSGGEGTIQGLKYTSR